MLLSELTGLNANHVLDRKENEHCSIFLIPFYRNPPECNTWQLLLLSKRKPLNAYETNNAPSELLQVVIRGLGQLNQHSLHVGSQILGIGDTERSDVVLEHARVLVDLQQMQQRALRRQLHRHVRVLHALQQRGHQLREQLAAGVLADAREQRDGDDGFVADAGVAVINAQREIVQQAVQHARLPAQSPPLLFLPYRPR